MLIFLPALLIPFKDIVEYYNNLANIVLKTLILLIKILIVKSGWTDHIEDFDSADANKAQILPL
jgi:energy-converting hydrogenase Eha subunit H